MDDKGELWEVCFEIMASYAGRMAVKDMKKVVKFYDGLTPEEQNRFDEEVAAERKRRFHYVMGEDSDDSDSDDGDDEEQHITTFDDIDRMNKMMNEALDKQILGKSSSDEDKVSTEDKSSKPSTRGKGKSKGVCKEK
ncbi:a29.1 [Rat cytomegalovirus ALL-03]|uniref:A29.1 n=2 Tax=Rat cytomegalovirus (isolate England) TaxID=1261657 RepID=A0A0F6R540_RCMVE|nr:e29.1 [Murid betaherpesvirus 8]AKE44206.1 a29.1 [Rat cytomegalovirus ALL-03]AFX83351.1 e29.1 [Murid betaherpesvirus 8]WEG71823.1 protein m29.1 [Murid betaherpesvirus 8]WPH25213.1 protein m29.1 [Murid betaherpesvirus 8]WPH25346.1 protein m29.1 [Murid betaherpesvirus 8]